MKTQTLIRDDTSIKKDEALIRRIRDAAIDMMRKVSFDEKEHKYFFIETGSPLRGASTISSTLPKDWLAAWGAKEAVKHLGYSDFGETEIAEEMMEKIRSCKSVEEYQEILKEAKGAHGRKSKQALLDGTKGHEWMEGYVKAKMRGTELPEIPEGDLGRPMRQFVEWELENVAYWILSEARVAYPEKGYAGTLDAVAMLRDGRLAVIDFKFASHISEEYYLQTAGYQAAFEPYEIPFACRVIVRLPKTLTIDEYDKKTHRYRKVENSIEVKVVPTPYREDFEAFLNASLLSEWINKYTN